MRKESSWGIDDGLHFSEPGTAGCRTREKSRCWPSLWLPRPAGHPLPAGDPGGCFWPGSWCTDRRAEVVGEKLCPPHPRQCWWLDRRPADFSTVGESLPGKPPPAPSQHCPAEEAAAAVPSLLALSWEGLAQGSSAGTCMKGLILGYGPLDSRGRRRTQALKHWSPSLLVLLGWGSLFRASLVALLRLLNEGNWWTRHPISLPDGPDPILENLGFRTQDKRTLERCSHHRSQNLRLETEVLEQSVLP